MSERPALEEQPELLDAASYPERHDMVAMIRARSFLPQKAPKVFSHSGKLLIKRLKADQVGCEMLCWAVKLGLAARYIAWRFGISPNSVVNVRQAMTERGELEAVGKRIDTLLDRFVEVGYERITEGVLSGEIHPGQLPIPVLAGDDKRRQRDAGMVVGTDRTQAAVTAEQVMLAVAMARRAIESGSDARASKQAQIGHILDLDTGLDTAQAPSAAPIPTPQADVADPRGGGRDPAGAPNGRGDAPENSQP
jgi:hypothetical protein